MKCVFKMSKLCIFLVLGKMNELWKTVDVVHQFYFDGLVSDCSIFIANALEILQSCNKPLISSRLMFRRDIWQSSPLPGAHFAHEVSLVIYIPWKWHKEIILIMREKLSVNWAHGEGIFPFLTCCDTWVTQAPTCSMCCWNTGVMSRNEMVSGKKTVCGSLPRCCELFYDDMMVVSVSVIVVYKTSIPRSDWRGRWTGFTDDVRLPFADTSLRWHFEVKHSCMWGLRSTATRPGDVPPNRHHVSGHKPSSIALCDDI